MQVWKNIKTQLGPDMELVMQKSEERVRRGGQARQRRKRGRQEAKKV